MSSIQPAHPSSVSPLKSVLLASATLAIVLGAQSVQAGQSFASRLGVQKQQKTVGVAIDASNGAVARLSLERVRSLSTGDQVTFTPPRQQDGRQGDALSLRVDRARALGLGRHVWQLVEEEGGIAHAQFVVRNGVMAGAIHAGDDSWWRLLSLNDHFVSIESISNAELPPCGGVEAPPLPPGGEEEGDGPASGGLAQSGAEICSGSCRERTVDMAVFYTPLARVGAGGISQIQVLCELAVAQANVAFENSDSDTRVRIVYLGEVDYDDATESGHLDHFANGSDGVMDEVQLIMGYTGADVASLVVESGEGYCGVAFLGPARYHVNVRGCMGGFVLAHEFGHNLGACHAVGDGGGCGSGGHFSYSVGWRFLGDSGQEWRTTMAYSPGYRIPNYSNPDILHDGQPTGVPIDDSQEADNVATFVLTTPVVSGFACPPAYVQTIKLLPSDPAQLDLFGQSVAITDGRVIVGAYLADEVATNSGSTYVFRVADSSDGTCPPDPYGYDSEQCYIESAKPPVFGTRQDDGVGRAVAAEGDWMITGAALRDTMTVDKKGNEVIDLEQVGSVFIYERDSESWCLRQEIFADVPEEEDRFGTAVALDEQTVLVGIPRHNVDDDSYAGAVEFFERTGPSDAPWVSGGTILGDPDDFGNGAQFGSSVAVSDDHLAIGAPYALGGKGAVRIYQRVGSAWTYLQQLELPVGTGEASFGNAISMSGDSLLVGAPLEDSGDGRAYLYTYDDATWSLHQAFTPLGGEDGSQFGASVALDGDHGLIGAPRSPGLELSDTGAAFMLKRVATTWYMVAILTAFDAEEGDQYGLSVAVEGDVLAIGAGFDNDNGIQSGSIYVHPFEPLVDCNNNGYGDTLEILQGIAFDNNGNGRPDVCDCVGDMNFDGLVDGADLTYLLEAWNETGVDLRPDINIDGFVDGADLTILLGTWGDCPEI